MELSPAPSSRLREPTRGEKHPPGGQRPGLTAMASAFPSGGAGVSLRSRLFPWGPTRLGPPAGRALPRPAPAAPAPADVRPRRAPADGRAPRRQRAPGPPSRPRSARAEEAGGRGNPGTRARGARTGRPAPPGRTARREAGATRTRERARGTAARKGGRPGDGPTLPRGNPRRRAGAPPGTPLLGLPEGRGSEGGGGRPGEPGAAPGEPLGAWPPPPCPATGVVGGTRPARRAARPRGAGLREGARGPGRAWHAHPRAAAGGGDGGARPSAPRLPSWHRAR